jgi:hypothetical protein
MRSEGSASGDEEWYKREMERTMQTEETTNMDETKALLMDIVARLERIENRSIIREHYGIEEFAQLVGREPFTCREWARLGRIHAEKKGSGRGPHAAWVVSHEELLRYQRDGLLPLRRIPR